jgi:hypothetical protein
MSALLVSEVSTRRDYWRNIAVTPTEIQSSWLYIFVRSRWRGGRYRVFEDWHLLLISVPHKLYTSPVALRLAEKGAVVAQSPLHSL